MTCHLPTTCVCECFTLVDKVGSKSTGIHDRQSIKITKLTAWFGNIDTYIFYINISFLVDLKVLYFFIIVKVIF